MFVSAFLRVLYFDHNATHPLSTTARRAWIDAAERYIGNASSQHRLGERANRALNDAREKLGAFLGCPAHEIVWTSGATESNNAAVAHFAAASEDEAWISAIEHPCMFAAVQRHFPGRSRILAVRKDGVLDLDFLCDALKKRRPAFIALLAANNETGVLQPWREVLALCREQEVPFFCDAAQWLGKLPAQGLGACDFLSGCAHKFGGPPGVGFLKASARLWPLIVGGPQEDGRRAGTENLPGVLAMVDTLGRRETTFVADTLPEKLEMRTEFENGLRMLLPEVEIVGAEADRLWNTVSAVMPEIDCRQRWVVKLDKLGIAVSTGSACASGKEDPSHVLAAMGYTPAQAGRVLRFSSGWNTRAADWTALLSGVERAAQELRAALPA